ncbi:hypothetical protein VTP01DRAFT_6982 [Rhizomucor pusillus]|uniref:uncharacterized protein n=1 Tax=Rhizomucor pusillus TaxID=4840 RepID=UPI003743D570
MAVFLPVVLVGAPVGYFSWTTVFNGVDYQVAKISEGPVKDDQGKSISELLHQDYRPRSGMAAAAGSLVSFAALSKVTFNKETRHRLFFAKAPPNTNIRMATLKMGIELLIRSGIVFYGAAVGGAVAGRLAA